MLPTLANNEKPQANEAYDEVDTKFKGLKPALHKRRSVLHPYAEVEEEVVPLEGTLETAKGTLHVLHSPDEGVDSISVRISHSQLDIS